MVYKSGLDEHMSKKELPLVPSGDKMLDDLLNGGFRKDTIYLLIGNRKLTSKALVSTNDIPNFSKYSSKKARDFRVDFSRP